MDTHETNYFNTTLDEVYDIFIHEPVNWPHELDIKQRQSLVQKMITYYSTKEDYSKCANLEKILESLNG